MERVRTCQLNGHSRSLSFSAIIIVTILMMVLMIMIVAPCCQSVKDSENIIHETRQLLKRPARNQLSLDLKEKNNKHLCFLL